MPGLTAAHLRKLADDLELEEKGESDKQLRAEIAALKAKVEGASTPELNAALDGLTDDEEQEVARALAAYRAAKTDPPAGDPPEPEEKPKPKPKRKRDGRKNGQPYTWDVDDDGNRVDLDVVKIYSGSDEDDQVEVDDDADGW